MACRQTGYSPAEEDSHADVYIINSCAVTGVGVKKARQTVSHCKTLNPDGITVLCGCYPQAYPEEAVRNTGDGVEIHRGAPPHVLRTAAHPRV